MNLNWECDDGTIGDVLSRRICNLMYFSLCGLFIRCIFNIDCKNFNQSWGYITQSDAHIWSSRQTHRPKGSNPSMWSDFRKDKKKNLFYLVGYLIWHGEKNMNLVLRRVPFESVSPFSPVSWFLFPVQPMLALMKCSILKPD